MISCVIESRFLPGYSPVHNVILVQVLQREDQLGNVKPRPGLGKPAFLLQVPEQFPSALVVCDKEQVILCLEAEFQPDEEGRIERLLQDLALSDRMRDLLLCDDILLGQHLHGVDTFRVPFPNLEDFAKRSPSDQFEDLEILGREVDLALILIGNSVNMCASEQMAGQNKPGLKLTLSAS